MISSLPRFNILQLSDETSHDIQDSVLAAAPHETMVVGCELSKYAVNAVLTRKPGTQTIHRWNESPPRGLADLSDGVDRLISEYRLTESAEINPGPNIIIPVRADTDDLDRLTSSANFPFWSYVRCGFIRLDDGGQSFTERLTSLGPVAPFILRFRPKETASGWHTVDQEAIEEGLMLWEWAATIPDFHLPGYQASHRN